MKKNYRYYFMSLYWIIKYKISINYITHCDIISLWFLKLHKILWIDEACGCKCYVGLTWDYKKLTPKGLLDDIVVPTLLYMLFKAPTFWN